MNFLIVLLCTCLFFDIYGVSVSYKLTDFVVLPTQFLKHFHKKKITGKMPIDKIAPPFLGSKQFLLNTKITNKRNTFGLKVRAIQGGGLEIELIFPRP